MGKRGPAPKPSAQKKLEGTYREDRATANEFTPPAGAPHMPSWLNARAQCVWREMVPLLEPVLTLADGPALAAYCASYALMVEAQAILDAEGLYRDGRKHAMFQVVRDCAALCLQYGARFGLTPSDRTRLPVPAPEGGEAEDVPLFGAPLKVVGGG